MAALAILDEQGPDGFSMRATARALGVTPMALYHHVKDKAELAALVIEAATEDQPLAPSASEWQEEAMILTRWMRQAATSHPALFELRRTYRVWMPQFHEMADRWMRCWQQSGLDPDRAVFAAMTASAAIWGLVYDELHIRNRTYPLTDAELPNLPNAERLLTAVSDAAELFEFGVRAIIEGVHARLMREQTGAAGAPVRAS